MLILSLNIMLQFSLKLFDKCLSVRSQHHLGNMGNMRLLFYELRHTEDNMWEGQIL